MRKILYWFLPRGRIIKTKRNTCLDSYRGRFPINKLQSWGLLAPWQSRRKDGSREVERNFKRSRQKIRRRKELCWKVITEVFDHAYLRYILRRLPLLQFRRRRWLLRSWRFKKRFPIFLWLWAWSCRLHIFHYHLRPRLLRGLSLWWIKIYLLLCDLLKNLQKAVL
jgi:hypothetical protein